MQPDLILTDRTLMGHEARNQQLEDHYFGPYPAVVAFMQE